jgi:hypothetical protein
MIVASVNYLLADVNCLTGIDFYRRDAEAAEKGVLGPAICKSKKTMKEQNLSRAVLTLRPQRLCGE